MTTPSESAFTSHFVSIPNLVAGVGPAYWWEQAWAACERHHAVALPIALGSSQRERLRWRALEASNRGMLVTLEPADLLLLLEVAKQISSGPSGAGAGNDPGPAARGGIGVSGHSSADSGASSRGPVNPDRSDETVAAPPSGSVAAPSPVETLDDVPGPIREPDRYQEVIASRFAAGESLASLADDYNLRGDLVQRAIRVTLAYLFDQHVKLTTEPEQAPQAERFGPPDGVFASESGDAPQAEATPPEPPCDGLTGTEWLRREEGVIRAAEGVTLEPGEYRNEEGDIFVTVRKPTKALAFCGDFYFALGATERMLVTAVRRVAPESAAKPPAELYVPVCSTCNDTHVMTLHRDGHEARTVPCTRCPTPCPNCVQRAPGQGRGAYCAETPCDCGCHEPPGKGCAKHGNINCTVCRESNHLAAVIKERDELRSKVSGLEDVKAQLLEARSKLRSTLTAAEAKLAAAVSDCEFATDSLAAATRNGQTLSAELARVRGELAERCSEIARQRGRIRQLEIGCEQAWQALMPAKRAEREAALATLRGLLGHAPTETPAVAAPGIPLSAASNAIVDELMSRPTAIPRGVLAENESLESRPVISDRLQQRKP